MLQELHDDKGNEILIAGVFDGHGGTAASTTVRLTLPGFLTTALASFDDKAQDAEMELALSMAWNYTCDTYRLGCEEEEGECIAEYDPVHGIIRAGTGSKDMVSGTTCVTAVMSISKEGANALTILNCGDSRALLLGRARTSDGQNSKKSTLESSILYNTRDHFPGDPLEFERLMRANEAGLGFSIPQCSYSRWWLSVGDYRYALSRSLEGTFANSKGIISDADIETVSLTQALTDREDVCLLLASDGLFEVMDNEEIGLNLLKLRSEGVGAGDAAKTIVGQALKKGTSDNVSCVVIYFS